MSLEHWLQLAGVCHFGILIASALVPQVLDWKGELAKLPALFRELVWVHGAFIVLTIIGLGAISLVNASELAAGSGLARSFCAFAGIFWSARLVVQFTVFDARPFLTTPLLTVGYHGLTVVFTFLSVVYWWAALHATTVL
ncbi:MAG TPA: hypothetical protein VHB77_19090 [Planctomycetaceae bacterium]|nr:hypothetical protein [Planctomycetaceae bacterium]